MNKVTPPDKVNPIGEPSNQKPGMFRMGTPPKHKHKGEDRYQVYPDIVDPKILPVTPPSTNNGVGGSSRSPLQPLLDALFDTGVEVGGDITLERQFENDSKAYLRYRERATKEITQAIKDYIAEEIRQVECWQPVEGYEDHYEVSNTGNVRSLSRKTMGRWGKLKTNPGKAVLKTDASANGYLRVKLSKNGGRRHEYVHRLVAKAFVPTTKGKDCVNHKDFHLNNNRVGNLEWVTHKENTQYSLKAGRPIGICKADQEMRNKLNG